MTTAILWYAFDAVLVVNFVAYLVGRLKRSSLLRGIVFSNLDSAARNEHFQDGGHLHGMSPDEIAYDMAQNAVDCSEFTTPELTPYVREWMRKRGAGEWHT